MKITSKQQMYAMLAAGEFGNTTPQWFDVLKWQMEAPPEIQQWGIRSLIPGGPSQMYCPTDLVLPVVCHERFQEHGYNISPMIDSFLNVTLWAEVSDLPGGLSVYGIEYPQCGDSWRQRMPVDGRSWSGTSAMLLLRKHLNANSFEDVMELRERFPDHVYEFSAVEQCFGSVPHRNHIMWEVRYGY